MEEGVVVVGLCADGIECSPVEVAELLNELIAEVGALLVLLVIVKVDLELVSMPVYSVCSSTASYLNQHAEIRPDLGDLLLVGFLRGLGGNALCIGILREKALEDSPRWVACIGEGGADGYEDGCR